MNFPSVVRVMAIDDSDKEVMPLMLALNQAGIPAIRYTGRVEDLPDNPKIGVRVLFLDIELEGMNGKEDKEKVAMLQATVTRAINLSENGPLFIVVWSKHVDLAGSLVAALRKVTSALILYVVQDKAAYMRTEGGFDFEKIAKFIEEESRKATVADLYVNWEESVAIAASVLSARMANSIASSSSWADELSYAFYALYRAQCGKVELTSSKEQFLAACRGLGGGLLTEGIRQLEKRSFPDGFHFKNSLNGMGEAIIKAKLNTLTNTDTTAAALLLHPGACYVVNELSDDEKRLKSFLVYEIFEDLNPAHFLSDSSVKLCKAVITPACDVAQKKRITVENVTVERILYGLMFPSRLCEKPKKTARKYYIGDVYLKDEVVTIGFSFATLGFALSDSIPENADFAFQEEILFDLQSKAANHVNHLGNSLA